MRLLLGAAEGGVWPAVLVLLSHWFPRGERARANAYWMLCLPISVILSSPLSGWILSHWNWRVLLIAEGAFPFFWLIIWLVFIHDNPQKAGWVSKDEREYLEVTLHEESRDLDAAKPEAVWRALLNARVWIMIGAYFTQNFGNYGYLFWLPSALENLQKMSNQRVGFLMAVPYIVTAVGMVLISRHSDKHRERRGHAAFGLAWAWLLHDGLHPADGQHSRPGLRGNLNGGRRILWDDGAILVDTHGISAALGFRIRDGVDQWPRQPGRIFRSSRRWIYLPPHGRLPVFLCLTESGVSGRRWGDAPFAFANRPRQ